MFATLAANEWSAPLLHRRFEESIKFKLWNTTEQLDGVPELREHWRALPLFNSGGVKYNTPAAKSKPTKQENVPAAQAAPGDANNAARKRCHPQCRILTAVQAARHTKKMGPCARRMAGRAQWIISPCEFR